MVSQKSETPGNIFLNGYVNIIIPLRNLLAIVFMRDENVSPHFEKRFWRGNLDLLTSTPIF